MTQEYKAKPEEQSATQTGCKMVHSTPVGGTGCKMVHSTPVGGTGCKMVHSTPVGGTGCKMVHSTPVGGTGCKMVQSTPVGGTGCSSQCTSGGYWVQLTVHQGGGVLGTAHSAPVGGY